MRLREVILLWYRSVDYVKFEVKPFTVLYGRNNSGKTNVLENIYGVLSPAEMNTVDADHALPPGLRGSNLGGPGLGALIVQLEAGTRFDDDVLTLHRSDSSSPDESAPLPTSQAAFIGDYDATLLTFHDPRDYFRQVKYDSVRPSDRDHDVALRARFDATIVDAGPRPLPLFLDWDIDGIDTRVGDALMDYLRPQTKFIDVPVLQKVWTPLGVRKPGTPESWQIQPEIQEFLDGFAGLATRFLPDFLDGSIQAHVQVATMWKARFAVTLSYRDRESVGVDAPRERGIDAIGSLGRGSSRWVAARRAGMREMARGHIAYADGELVVIDLTTASFRRRWNSDSVANATLRHAKRVGHGGSTSGVRRRLARESRVGPAHACKRRIGQHYCKRTRRERATVYRVFATNTE